MVDPSSDIALRAFLTFVMGVVAGIYLGARLLAAWFRYRRGGFK